MLDFDAKHVQGVIFLLEVPVKLLVQLTTRKHSSERKEVQRVKNIKVYISDRVLDQLSTGGGQNIFTQNEFYSQNRPFRSKVHCTNALFSLYRKRTRIYMRNTPYFVSSGTGLAEAERQRLITRLVSAGSMIPSSHSLAVE
jgi:hypothetical protein